MEDVWALYAAPYDPRRPQVCLDESPGQLIREMRQPLPVRPGPPARYDYEYRRQGTANLFLLVQPLRGWRHVNVTTRRTKGDFAVQMQELVDVHCPEAEVMRRVVDKLNTQTPAALYETFRAEEARRLTRKLEFHSTPKPGSWLNMAECAFAVLTQQCLDRRLPDIATLSQEIAAWQAPRNRHQTGINWGFSTTDARVKLKRLYPSVSDGEHRPKTELRRAA